MKGDIKMNSETNRTSKQYIHSMHNYGRACAVAAILIMLGMPLTVSIYFGYMPSPGEVIAASAALLAIFIPTSISEVVSYTPVLGSSIYLTLITGNVMNLKLPAATNAMELLDCEYGTEEADIIGLIAVSASSFTTLIIIAIGVILMIPLRPVLDVPAVKTASAYILPALFGNLLIRLSSPHLGGGITSPNRLKAAVIPTLLIFAVCICDNLWWHKNIMTLYQGFVVILLIPMLYFSTKILYQKGHIQVYLPGEKPER